MANAEFNALTAQMIDAERDVVALTSKLRVAEGILRDIRNKRSVIFGRMLEAATVIKQPEQPSRRTDWHYDSQGYCDNPGRGY